MSKPTPQPLLLTYEDVALLFKAERLPHSRWHLNQVMKKHRRLCPARRISYKTVRFEHSHVQRLLARMLEGGL